MNWNIFSPASQVVIQGMTGKEGSRMARWLLQSGVQVVAGVTPGKGGQQVEGCPIFDTVQVARVAFPEIAVSCVVVPPSRVLSAVHEAMDAGIRFMTILSENVPVHDALAMRKRALEEGVAILGPSSVGYVQFPAFRLGYLGGENPFTHMIRGNTAILSTSGGMTNELIMSLSAAGIGIKLACAIGGDRVPCLSLIEMIRWSESQVDVATLAIFAEPGQPLLRLLVSGAFRFQKPAVIFLAGETLDDLPRGSSYGHTGTILGEDDLSVNDLRTQLRERGVTCVGSMSEFLLECKKICLNP